MWCASLIFLLSIFLQANRSSQKVQIKIWVQLIRLRSREATLGGRLAKGLQSLQHGGCQEGRRCSTRRECSLPKVRHSPFVLRTDLLPIRRAINKPVAQRDNCRGLKNKSIPVLERLGLRGGKRTGRRNGLGH